MNSQLQTFLDEIKKVPKPRTVTDSFIYTLSEIGELAEELNKLNGNSIKPQGKDGVIGEAVDGIVCLLDVINQYNPSITGLELENIMLNKIKKWQDKWS